jgi:hypothetical protein
LIRKIQLGTTAPPSVYRKEVHELLYAFCDRCGYRIVNGICQNYCYEYSPKPNLKEKQNVMPVKKVALTELPEKSNRGTIIPEVQEVMDALNGLPDNQAIAVELSTETTIRLGKGKGDKTRNPLRVFASTLKRHFKNNGLSFEVFHSDAKKQVFVRKTTKTQPTTQSVPSAKKK